MKTCFSWLSAFARLHPHRQRPGAWLRCLSFALLVGLAAPVAAGTPGAGDPLPGFVAQNFGLVRFNYHTGQGFRHFLPQPDGSFLVAGEFSGSWAPPNTHPPLGLMWLDPLGSPQPVSSPISVPAAVNGVVQDRAGRVFLAGSIKLGFHWTQLARLRADRRWDTNFPAVSFTGQEPTSGPLTLALDSGERLLIGGSFAAVDGQPRAGLARLSLDGVLDAHFAPDIQPPAGDTNAPRVEHLAVLPGDTLLLAGEFGRVDGQPRQRLARLLPDGRLDPGFDPGPAVSNRVTALLALPGGGVLLAQQAPGESATLLRLHADGSPDVAFAYGHAPFPSTVNPAEVRGLARGADGSVWIAGKFRRFHGLFRPNLVRLRPDGVLDEKFPGAETTPPGGAASTALNVVTPLPDGRLLVGGTFTYINGMARQGFARLLPDGTVDVNYGRSGAAWGNGQPLARRAGGWYVSGYGVFNGVAVPGLVRLTPDGALDQSFAATNALSLSGQFTTAMAEDPAGRLLVNGGRTPDGWSVLQRLLPDGRRDPEFKVTPANISSVSVREDGRIYVGGVFEAWDGRPTASLLRLLPEGSLDETFAAALPLPVSPSTNRFVLSVEATPDGGVFASGLDWAGRFLPDGRLHPDYPAGLPHDSRPSPARLLPDGAVLTLRVDATGTRRVRRMLPGGQSDPAFNPPTVRSLVAALPDGKFLAEVATTATGSRLRRFFANGLPDDGFTAWPGSASTLAAGLSHDARTLLLGIGSSLHLVRADSPALSRFARLSDGTLRVDVNERPLHDFAVEHSPDLRTWTMLTPVTLPLGGLVSVTNEVPAGGGSLFLRVVPTP